MSPGATCSPSRSEANSDLAFFYNSFCLLYLRAGLWQGSTMMMTPETTACERGVRPLLQIVLQDKADAVVNFRPDPALQDRIEALAAKSTEGELSGPERGEYEGYVRANKFIAILQRQARQFLRN